MTVERFRAFEYLRKALTAAPLLLIPDFKLPLNIYIDTSGDGLGASIYQVHIINEKPIEGPICVICRKIKPTDTRYGESQMECLCLVRTLERLNELLEGCVFEVITNFTAIETLSNINTSSRNMLRWQIAIQEYRGNMNIVHKDGNIPKNSDWLGSWPLPNDIENPAFVPEEASPQTPIKVIIVAAMNITFFEELRNSYTQYGIIYHRNKHTCLMTAVDRSLINLLLKEFRDRPFSGLLSEKKTREKVKTCIWWPMWQKDVSEY
ncbi:hypothetical protein O181_130041 [Austropuccinia psidii MF-1]|uniref:Reverse transcriptase RNase H-like domain-containing protein n=1 Tax=Austropuccinia psidii MF-1 TaxID=1389203 RepID=A0A9Q3L1A0_9BASI|nr:hypothetical protein [Austropuccinia psidii MF-1]